MNKNNPKYDPNFVFPHSIQSDLFCYLKPEQQSFIKPILRVLKKPAQEELCCMLLDYMESGECQFTNDVVVGGMFNYLTRCQMPESDDLHSTGSGQAYNKQIIRPLHVSKPNMPQRIGSIIKGLLPKSLNPQL